jgi:hypothetical protein
MKLLRIVATTVRWLVLAILTIWATAALYFDLHPLAGAAYLLAVVAIFALLKGPWRSTIANVVAFALVLTWWFTLRPSNDRPWQPDVDRTAWVDIVGDQVTIHNFRNCDYRTETDYTPDWETKTIRLSDLRGADIAIDYWGSPWMAHPMVSFQFGDGEHVVFSIETRKEIGESYSAVRGFFRQYELIYLVGDERDFFRVRTNYRKGEDLYLYQLHLNPQQLHERFMEYVTRLNELHTQPAWYNALTTNCTTSIRGQRASDALRSRRLRPFRAFRGAETARPHQRPRPRRGSGAGFLPTHPGR